MRKIFLIWGAEIEKQSALYPPLGLSYLNAVLKKHNYKTEILDLIFDKNMDCIKNMEISDGIYCISVLTPMFNRVKRIIELIRKKDTKALIILGGPHPTALPEESLKQLNADIICLGEAEKSLVEVIQCLEKGRSIENIDGIAYKEGEGVVINPKTRFIENIDEIPFADQSPFDVEEYFRRKGFRELSIITTRGCSGNCTFCQPSLRMLFGKRLRMESPKRVVDEIEWLVKKHKLDLLSISDDAFGFNPKRVRQICQLMIKRKINIFWRCQSRVGLDFETLKLMKRAGCILIAFGIESGSQQILDEIRKGITINQIKETFKLCKKVGILTHAYLMIGNIGESEKTIQETIDLIKEIKAFSVNVSVTTPYPGTCLYDYVVKANMLLSKNWDEYDHILPSSSVIKLKGISKYIRKYKVDIEATHEKYSTKFSDLYRLALDFNFVLIFLNRVLINPSFIFEVLKLVVKSMKKRGLLLTNPEIGA